MEYLQVDYLDLYLMHFPVSWKKECKVPQNSTDLEYVNLQDTWRAMEKLVDMGLVKNIGVSNFGITELQQLLYMPGLKYAPQVNQIEFHPYCQKLDVVKFCQQRGIAVTGHSSLGGGDNPWTAFHPDVKLMDHPIVVDVAKQVNRSSAQVLLRWCIQNDVIVIPKSVTKSRLEQNLALFDFELTEEHMSSINSLEKGSHAVFCHPATTWCGKALFPDELEALKKEFE